MGHIFISYSTKDIETAGELIDALKREGFDPWVDVEGLGPGTHWRARLETQIETCDAYILIVSKNSKKSKWVKEELSLAQDLNKPVFPLRIDNTKPFFGIRTIQYEDIRKGQLPSEEFYQRLADVTKRKKIVRRRKTIRTEKAKKQVVEGASQLLTHYSREFSSKSKDLIAKASKSIAKTTKKVKNSDTMKKVSSSTKKSIKNLQKRVTRNK
ncbi:MAG TPA: toll/interleukin-1 receptor domain-containing protein [Anaerolineales bacterium]|nr:toll/interleukin-1 receptor domain-containing protein [Anaerolineales bacterium]